MFRFYVCKGLHGAFKVSKSWREPWVANTTVSQFKDQTRTPWRSIFRAITASLEGTSDACSTIPASDCTTERSHTAPISLLRVNARLLYGRPSSGGECERRFLRVVHTSGCTRSKAVLTNGQTGHVHRAPDFFFWLWWNHFFKTNYLIVDATTWSYKH